MAEGFELYHIPQQSRRDKLRVVIENHHTSNGRSAVVTPHGPDAGHGSILKRSKFLKPAQELLDEICDVGFGVYGDKFPVDCVMMIDSPPLENLRISVDDSSCGGVDKRKRSSLISLLDEVYKRYKQYYQQIRTVITSLETVSGIKNAAPFANLDIKAMSRHFHCLKNAIIEQLQFSLKPREHHISYGNKEFMLSGSLDKGHYGQMGFVDHPLIWRPQRGLPKRAVTVLRSWLFDHFLHPYPTDTDKQSLAKQTGLSRNQVSNWFINARVRLWKPMVEEVHTLETRQARTSPVRNSFSSQPMNQEPPSKRARNDFPSDNKYSIQQIMEGNKEHMNFYENVLIQTGNNHTSVNRGLPLTLGLQKNNTIFTLSEAFPLNANGGSRRLVVGGLDARNGQVGRDIIGGQYVHDFRG